MIRLATLSIALLGAGTLTLATLNAASAADTTVSGTLVDVAKWVSNDSSTATLNMSGVMMSSMLSNAGGMMSGSNSSMSGPSSSTSAHHPSGETAPSQESTMGMGMSGGMMGCHATLGIVTSSGDLYVLLANRASPMGALGLCGQVGQRVTVTGTTYVRGGVRALLVSKLPQ